MQLMNPGDYFSVTSAGSKVAVVNCDYQPTPRDGKANHISAKQGDFVMLEQEEQSLPAECVMVSTATTQGLLPKHVLSRIEGYSEGLHITRDELQLLPVEVRSVLACPSSERVWGLRAACGMRHA